MLTHLILKRLVCFYCVYAIFLQGFGCQYLFFRFQIRSRRTEGVKHLSIQPWEDLFVVGQASTWPDAKATICSSLLQHEWLLGVTVKEEEMAKLLTLQIPNSISSTLVLLVALHCIRILNQDTSWWRSLGLANRFHTSSFTSFGEEIIRNQLSKMTKFICCLKIGSSIHKGNRPSPFIETSVICQSPRCLRVSLVYPLPVTRVSNRYAEVQVRY